MQEGYSARAVGHGMVWYGQVVAPGFWYIESLILFEVRVVLIMTDKRSASRYHCAGIVSRIDEVP